MTVQGYQSSVDSSNGKHFLSFFVSFSFFKKRNLISVSYFIALDPDPPSDLLILGQEENTIYLSWKFPQGGFEKFQVKKKTVLSYDFSVY